MKFVIIIIGLSSMLNFIMSIDQYILIHDLPTLENLSILPEETWEELTNYDNDSKWKDICNRVKKSRLIYSQNNNDLEDYYIRRISAIITDDESYTEFGETSVVYKDADEISIPVIYCVSKNFVIYIAKNINYDYYFLFGIHHNRTHEDCYTDNSNSVDHNNKYDDLDDDDIFSDDWKCAELGHDYEDQYNAIPLAVIAKYLPLTNAAAINFNKPVLKPMDSMYNVKLMEACASTFHCLSSTDDIINAVSSEVEHHRRICDKSAKPCKHRKIPTLVCTKSHSKKIPDEKLLIQYNVKSDQPDKTLSKVCLNNIAVNVYYPLI